MTAYIEMMSNYFTFSGKMGRGSYWSAFGIVFIMLVAAILMDEAAYHPLRPRGELFLSVATLIHVIPMTAAGVRRLRSTGLSGWWYVMAFIPLLNIVCLILLLRKDKPE